MVVWNRRSIRWAIYIGVVIAVLSTGGLVWLRHYVAPPIPTGRTVQFVVHSGETPRAVARQLRASGLVRSAFWFRVYLSGTGQARRLEAGEYRFAVGLTYGEIASALQRGQITAISVTVPEGFTVSQIAERLQAADICTKASFLRAEEHDKFPESFVESLPEPPQVRYRLEGYLYPDTYNFSRGESAHDVVNAMLQNFSRHVNGSLMAEATSAQMTLPALITEASLIEREAKIESDRPLIASVIDNRLKRDMPLSIDASIQYVLGPTRTLTRKDTRLENPYNTYLHRGLPPGPIASPGMPSIEAALHPARTHYLYYVAKNDGSGGSYFASTYTQQLQNERRSERNLHHARTSI